MSYCKFCGKELITSDEIDRCNPSCITQNITFEEIKNTVSDYDLIELQRQEKQAEINQLKAENEKLKEALREIIALDDGNSILKYYERYYQVFRLARQALNEVKEC